jgi:hypothetical protein
VVGLYLHVSIRFKIYIHATSQEVKTHNCLKAHSIANFFINHSVTFHIQANIPNIAIFVVRFFENSLRFVVISHSLLKTSLIQVCAPVKISAFQIIGILFMVFIACADTSNHFAQAPATLPIAE